MSKVKLSICIPAYNGEKTIEDSIRSAMAQNFKDKEILIIDDCSTDNTINIINNYNVRIIKNSANIGIGKNLEKLMREAKGEIVVFLCQDDLFTNGLVCWDIYNTFKDNQNIGIIGRSYYEFMNGHQGPVGTFRQERLITGSCNPSGMAFRQMEVEGSNKIFVEMPNIVVEILSRGWEWTMLPYDSIAVRIHPSGNTATKSTYYNGSMYQNWYDLLGEPLGFYQGLIQIKARAPKNLHKELEVIWKTDKKARLSVIFWFFALMALIVPSGILRNLSSFYRHRIGRMFASVKER